jgi:Na+(H+)/acetate symporter ActP
MKRTVWTVVITAVVLIAFAVLLVASGMINMAATSKPFQLEKALANLAVRQSMSLRAPATQNPYSDDDEAIQASR